MFLYIIFGSVIVVCMWCAERIATVNTQGVYWLITQNHMRVHCQHAAGSQTSDSDSTLTVQCSIASVLYSRAVWRNWSCCWRRRFGCLAESLSTKLQLENVCCLRTWPYQRSLSCSRQYTSSTVSPSSLPSLRHKTVPILSHTCTTSHRSAVLPVPWHLTLLSDTTRPPLGAVNCDKAVLSVSS